MYRQQFIDDIALMAVADMMQTNVLASITIAQACEESADGFHAPRHNLFGIKSTIEGTGQLLWTQEYIGGKLEQVQDWFRVYPDWSGSIADHSAFLIRNGRYTLAGLFICCDRLDYVGAAHALQAAGYATNPSYAKNLVGIIEQYKLYEYDQEAVSNLQEIKDLQDRVAKLEAEAEVTGVPKWFTDEFGEHALDGLVLDQTGNHNFWRGVTVLIQAFRKKGL